MDSSNSLDLTHAHPQLTSMILIRINNYSELMRIARTDREEALSSRMLGLIHKHIGFEFDTLVFKFPEIHLIFPKRADSKLIENCNNLRAGIKGIRLGDGLPILSSICLTHLKCQESNFDMLLRAQKILDIAAENEQYVLCIA